MADPTKDLVLTIRLAALGQSLDQVMRVVPSAQQRLKYISALDDLLTSTDQGILASVDKLSSAIRYAEAQLEPVARRDLRDTRDWRDTTDRVDETMRILSSTTTEIGALLNLLDEAKRMLAEMRRRSVEIAEENELGRVEVVQGATTVHTEITRISRTLLEAKQAKEIHDDEAANRLLQESWEKYGETVYGNRLSGSIAQKVFAEYVDLLGGLALRDTGFDGGICQFADQLIYHSALGKEIRWRSFTIPTLEEAEDVSPARIIRLGFPEWTLWALPLTSHELGHVVVDQDQKVGDLIKTVRANDRARYRQFAADAIATYVMGPAYACAVILLRLDPLIAYQGSGSAHALRAHVVFQILERMDNNAGDSPLTTFIENLSGEWDAALEQAQPKGPLSDPAKLEREIEQLNKWLIGLWEHLDGVMIGSSYPADNWPGSQDWGAYLVEPVWWPYPTTEEKKVWFEEKGGRIELRDVLTAAWACRVNQPDKAEQIAENAWGLWKYIVERRTEQEGRGYDRRANVPQRH